MGKRAKRANRGQRRAIKAQRAKIDMLELEKRRLDRELETIGLPMTLICPHANGLWKRREEIIQTLNQLS